MATRSFKGEIAASFGLYKTFAILLRNRRRMPFEVGGWAKSAGPIRSERE
jgi:hypothetical protein